MDYWTLILAIGGTAFAVGVLIAVWSLARRAGDPGGTVSAASPLKLTDFGLKIRKSMKPGDWVERRAAELEPQTKGMEPFEIDELSRVQSSSGLDDEMSRRVRKAAYEFGCEPPLVHQVLRVLLRDALLEANGLEAAGKKPSDDGSVDLM